MTNEPLKLESEVRTSDAVYEAPQIESVLEADDLEREVAYAGIQAVSPGLAA